jgi:hypothetical protein
MPASTLSTHRLPRRILLRTRRASLAPERPSKIETSTSSLRNLTKADLCPLRWIYLHMIEEYARHNGHADLLRERIDGMTDD